MNVDAIVPASWMKVLIVDPGTARAGLLGLAVPPPPKGHDGEYFPRHVHAYAERMLYNADANEMAKEAKILTGDRKFETFVIDKRAGKQTPMGYSHNVREQYAMAFESFGVKSRLTGYDFEYSSDDVDGRELLLKKWLAPGDDGERTLKVHNHLTGLQGQMRDFFRSKSDPKKRDAKAILELVHCLEYGAAYFDDRLWYNDPEPVEEEDKRDPVIRMLEQFKANNWHLSKQAKLGAPNFGCNFPEH